MGLPFARNVWALVKGQIQKSNANASDFFPVDVKYNGEATYWGLHSRLTFYNGIKMFAANKVLFKTTEEKLLELLALVTAYVCWKYKIFFYGES